MDKQDQLELIRRWVDSGESRPSTVAKTATQFGISYADAQSLVHQAMAGVTAIIGEIERPEFLAQQMTRLEALAVKAQDQDNLTVALGCLKELNALAKLYDK